MGTLMGHTVPGTFFLLSSFWLCYNVFRNYYRSMLKSGPNYFNTPWHPVSCGRTQIPLESVIKVVAVAIGIVGETVTAFDEHGVFRYLGNTQHMTMYLFFGLNGATDLLIHYSCLRLPQGFQYLTMVLAFGVEGFIFSNHLHGRSPMDVQLHTFLVYVIVSCALCALLEMHFRHNALPALCRAYFMFTQGTWFFQVGLTLYPLNSLGMKAWDQESHLQMMVVTLIFAWHLAMNFVFVLVVGVFVLMKSKRGRFDFIDDVEYQPITCNLSNHRLCSPKMGSIKSDINETETLESQFDSSSEM